MEQKVDELLRDVMALGAKSAASLPAEEIPTDRRFRDACVQNACGYYGRCWVCPPDAGDIDALIRSLGAYTTAVVFQTVSDIEDSFDIEGMHDAALRHNALVRRVKARARALFPADETLTLGAGACGVCDTCAKVTGEPCRFPAEACPSMEAYGVAVSALAPLCGMRYIHGPNTVTYFGMVLLGRKAQQEADGAQ